MRRHAKVKEEVTKERTELDHTIYLDMQALKIEDLILHS